MGTAALVAAMLALTVPPAEAAAPGANVDLSWGISQADVDQEIALLQAAGVSWVRLGISWKAVEPNAKGSYNTGYLSNMDTIVGKLRAAGIQIVMPLSDSVPYWASADPDKYVDSHGTTHWNYYYRPSRFSDYGDVFGYIAGRYAPQGVHVFEVWNEPNLKSFWPSGPSAAEYTSMLKAAYPAIKAQDPSATVLGGALSQDDYAFLRGVYAAGGGSYFDAVSTHEYPNNGPAHCVNDGSGHRDRNDLCSIEEIRRVMVDNGDRNKKIWLDEFGWSTCSNSYSGCWGKGVTEDQQAKYLTGAFRLLDGYPYVASALVYSFRNTYWKNDAANDWSADLGLLRTDFSKKPAFGALKTYSGLTNGTAPTSAPTVALSSPEPGETMTGRKLAVTADAADDQAVDRVDFRVDGRTVATDSTAPYEATLRVRRHGAHAIQAVAYDPAGATAASTATVDRIAAP